MEFLIIHLIYKKYRERWDIIKDVLSGKGIQFSSIYLYVCLSVYLSICLSICLSVSLSIYLSIYLSSYLYSLPYMYNVYLYYEIYPRLNSVLNSIFLPLMKISLIEGIVGRLKHDQPFMIHPTLKIYSNSHDRKGATGQAFWYKIIFKIHSITELFWLNYY